MKKNFLHVLVRYVRETMFLFIGIAWFGAGAYLVLAPVFGNPIPYGWFTPVAIFCGLFLLAALGAVLETYFN